MTTQYNTVSNLMYWPIISEIHLVSVLSMFHLHNAGVISGIYYYKYDQLTSQIYCASGMQTWLILHARDAHTCYVIIRIIIMLALMACFAWCWAFEESTVKAHHLWLRISLWPQPVTFSWQTSRNDDTFTSFKVVKQSLMVWLGPRKSNPQPPFS